MGNQVLFPHLNEKFDYIVLTAFINFAYLQRQENAVWAQVWDLGTESPLKHNKKCFLFHLKKSFRSQEFCLDILVK